jgi:methionine synthase II (cobalamin-independent)
MKKFLTLFFLLSFYSSFSQVENNLYKTNFHQLQDFETYLKEEIKSLKAAGIEILINHKGEKHLA